MDGAISIIPTLVYKLKSLELRWSFKGTLFSDRDTRDCSSLQSSVSTDLEVHPNLSKDKGIKPRNELLSRNDEGGSLFSDQDTSECSSLPSSASTDLESKVKLPRNKRISRQDEGVTLLSDQDTSECSSLPSSASTDLEPKVKLPRNKRISRQDEGVTLLSDQDTSECSSLPSSASTDFEVHLKLSYQGINVSLARILPSSASTDLESKVKLPRNKRISCQDEGGNFTGHTNRGPCIENARQHHREFSRDFILV
ncbi:hypothetical protein J6590_062601 [Homalodisca vitripennis]|nr:hypothetical protein J6590_062601 [Homalodisca vitripennis]